MMAHFSAVLTTGTVPTKLKELIPLAKKPTIIVATKIDAVNPAKLKKLATYAKRRKLEFYPVSAVTGAGIDELKWALARRVRPEDRE